MPDLPAWVAADKSLGVSPIWSGPDQGDGHMVFVVAGGVTYHGEKLPELRGAYIYGDHSTGTRHASTLGTVRHHVPRQGHSLARRIPG